MKIVLAMVLLTVLVMRVLAVNDEEIVNVAKGVKASYANVSEAWNSEA